jgi:predicted NUDIX family NTP pyrophosphohydrolase
LSAADSAEGRARRSAGLLMFRRAAGGLEFLLVHPGGPFFSRKDDGAWTIPKGEAAPAEDLLTRARTEFAEELGVEPVADHFLSLGSFRQKGGKTVHAWAFEGTLAPDFVLCSNTFEMEWPPRSGNRRAFPEIDRYEFFREEIARRKINPAQAVLFDRLAETLKQG